MSDKFNVVRYCLTCKVSVPAEECPRCGADTSKVPRSERRRPRHAAEGAWSPGDYHVSEDLWRLRARGRRAEIGYSEE